MSEEKENNEILIGYFLLKSGMYLPFAAKKLNWKMKDFEIVSVEHHFVAYEDIGIVNYVNWELVDAIVVEKTVNDDGDHNV